MLEALGNIGDFLGGIGVVVTLIYLSVQIRQNTDQLRSDAEQRKLSSLDEINRALADWQSDLVVSPEVADIWIRGLKGEEKLRGTDRIRFEYHGARLVQMWQGNFFRYLDTGDAENWKISSHHIRMFMDRPGFRAYWEATRHLYGDEFRKEVDRLAASPPEAAGRFDATAS